MYINLEKFKELLNSRFDNNLHKCARALEMDVSTVSRVVRGNNNAGARFLGNLMNYCNKYGLDFKEFIFLPEPLRETNSGHRCNTA